jgi:hypothetical protein
VLAVLVVDITDVVGVVVKDITEEVAVEWRQLQRC